MHIHYLTAFKITMIEVANAMTAAGHLIGRRHIQSNITAVEEVIQSGGGHTHTHTPLTGIHLAQPLDTAHVPSLNSLPSLHEQNEAPQVFSA